MDTPELKAGPIDFEINFPEEPTLQGARSYLPLVEPWFAQYIRKGEDGQYHTALAPLIGWMLDIKGNRKGVRAPLSEPGEGFQFAGYVRGRQIADLIPRGDDGTLEAVSFETMYDRMTAHRIQQNRIATQPARDPSTAAAPDGDA